MADKNKKASNAFFAEMMQREAEAADASRAAAQKIQKAGQTEPPADKNSPPVRVDDEYLDDTVKSYHISVYITDKSRRTLERIKYMSKKNYSDVVSEAIKLYAEKYNL